MTDKFTETLEALEQADTNDTKLAKVVDLFKMVYQGFALQQRHIAAVEPDTQTKLTQLGHDIDSKLRRLTDEIAATKNDTTTLNQQVTKLDQAARQIDATVQQMGASQ